MRPLEPALFDGVDEKIVPDASVDYATLLELVARLTSDRIMDYTAMTDFFLTFRMFAATQDVLHLLFSRLEWAATQTCPRERGRDVGVRTYVAIRYWFLNFFADDFLVDHRLREYAAWCMNTCYGLPEVMASPQFVKIVEQLKRCWLGELVEFWDLGKDALSSADLSLPVFAGGVYSTSIGRDLLPQSASKRRLTLLRFYDGPIAPIQDSVGEDQLGSLVRGGIKIGENVSVDTLRTSPQRVRPKRSIWGLGRMFRRKPTPEPKSENVALDGKFDVLSLSVVEELHNMLKERPEARQNDTANGANISPLSQRRMTFNTDSDAEMSTPMGSPIKSARLRESTNTIRPSASHNVPRDATYATLDTLDIRHGLCNYASGESEADSPERAEPTCLNIDDEPDEVVDLRQSSRAMTGLRGLDIEWASYEGSLSSLSTFSRPSLVSVERRDSVDSITSRRNRNSADPWASRRASFIWEPPAQDRTTFPDDIIPDDHDKGSKASKKSLDSSSLKGEETTQDVVGVMQSSESTRSEPLSPRVASISAASLSESDSDAIDSTSHTDGVNDTSDFDSKLNGTSPTLSNDSLEQGGSSESTKSTTVVELSVTASDPAESINENQVATNENHLTATAPDTFSSSSVASSPLPSDSEQSLRSTHISSTALSRNSDEDDELAALEQIESDPWAEQVHEETLPMPQLRHSPDGDISLLSEQENEGMQPCRGFNSRVAAELAAIPDDDNNNTSVNEDAMELTMRKLEGTYKRRTALPSFLSSSTGGLYSQAFLSQPDLNCEEEIAALRIATPDTPSLASALEQVNTDPRHDTKKEVSSQAIQLIASLRPLAEHAPFILSFSAQELADQMMLIERDALEHVDWKDLIELRWPSDEPQMVSSWLQLLRDRPGLCGVEIVGARFNLVVGWIKSEILLCKSAALRAQTVSRLIHTAKASLRAQNFATTVQVTLALSSQTVQGLRQIWPLVPQVDIEDLRKLESLVSPAHNFARLRRAHYNVDPRRGCIPFTGLYLADLVWNNQKPSSRSDGEIHVSKFRHAAAIVRSLVQCIEWAKNSRPKPVSAILSKLLYLRTLDENEFHSLAY